MGMPYPTSIKLASGSENAADITPWLWGINGAFGVCASVAAIPIALSAGISASLWTGFGCYVIAGLGFWRWRAKF